MKLSHLLTAIGRACPREADITAITCDSRSVVPGALFAALPGAQADGAQYIPQAEDAGATAILCAQSVESTLPVIVSDSPRRDLALLAAAFYGHPAQQLTLIAVTGTKGKTTTAHMLRDILTAAGHTVGMIGTLGAYIGIEKVAEARNTTPEPVQLHALLRDMADRGCTHVVMEVSSQAMKLDRVAGLDFALGIFLNLSPDHIGGAEHKDFEEYQACKAALFRQCAIGVGNGDDPAWPAMAAQLPPDASAITFGFGHGTDIQGVAFTPDSSCGPLCSRLTVAGGASPYRVPLPGTFNAANALAAIAAARALGVEEGAIRAGLGSVTVPGRTQRYPRSGEVTVLIDYAHNEASIRALLSALQGYEHNRIIVVFGAGGSRPAMRRLGLAQAAAELADLAIVTADNPRWEPVEDICAQITEGLRGKIPYEVVYNRREAIFRALDLAQAGDIVALLGKGHETYIEEQGVRRHFSEWKVLEEYYKR